MLLCYQWTVIYKKKKNPLNESEDRRPHTPPPSSWKDCLIMFFFFFMLFDLSSVFFKWREKKMICILRISGEREMENISAHGPKKYTCQKKKHTHKSASCTWFCLNKFTLSWETRVPRKTTFVTFSVLGIVYQTPKGFITLTAAGAFPAERRGSVRICVFHFVDHLLFSDLFCDLHSNWNSAILEYSFPVGPQKANLESLCLFRWCGLFLSRLRLVWPEVWLRNQQSARPSGLSFLATSCAKNHRIPSPSRQVSQRRHSGVWILPPVSSLSHLAPAVLVQRLQQQQQLEKESGVHVCSCLLFSHWSFKGRSLCLGPDFILCRRQHLLLFAIKWKGNTTEEKDCLYRKSLVDMLVWFTHFKKKQRFCAKVHMKTEFPAVIESQSAAGCLSPRPPCLFLLIAAPNKNGPEQLSWVSTRRDGSDDRGFLEL